MNAPNSSGVGGSSKAMHPNREVLGFNHIIGSGTEIFKKPAPKNPDWGKGGFNHIIGSGTEIFKKPAPTTPHYSLLTTHSLLTK